jgi:superfamily II DNA or RNA helicase
MWGYPMGEETHMLSEIATPTITLRPYQELCIERVLEAYACQPQGGKALVVLPTGGGKTIVFTSIAQRLGLNTLIIAHRQELLQQAADKFRLVDPMVTIGQVGAGKHEYGYKITVASVQTISRPNHLEMLKQFGYGLVIIDECHHSRASGYQAVLDALPSAFVLGVTATPDRLDKKSIESIFGEPVFTTSILDLIEQGYLCDLRAVAVRTTTDLSEVHTQGGDFKTDELEEAIDTKERNERVVRAYQEHCPGRQALCFAVTVAHAHHLACAFKAQGVPAAVVSGETPPDERKRILSDYEHGALSVVCNCGVLTEGYDAPATSCIILARPTQSRALFVQCIGRGTRLADGKSDCIILDITDNCLKHRLEPLTLSKALDTDLKDGESIGERKRRAIREEKEERKTRVTKRAQDLTVDLLTRMDWKLHGHTGIYELVVGAARHRIKLVPSETTFGSYSVQAELAPFYMPQEWLREATLSDAQQHAEIKARLLQSSEKKLALVDANMPWRAQLASSKQLYMLKKHHIPYSPDITSGEASDLIGRALATTPKKTPAASRKGGKQHGKRR